MAHRDSVGVASKAVEVSARGGVRTNTIRLYPAMWYVLVRGMFYKAISVNKYFGIFSPAPPPRRAHKRQLAALAPGMTPLSLRPLVLGVRPPCSALSTTSGYKIGPESSLIAKAACWLRV